MAQPNVPLRCTVGGVECILTFTAVNQATLGPVSGESAPATFNFYPDRVYVEDDYLPNICIRFTCFEGAVTLPNKVYCLISTEALPAWISCIGSLARTHYHEQAQ